MLLLISLAAAAPVVTTLAPHSCPANTTARHSVSPNIIVQGGIQPNTTARQSVSPRIIVQGGTQPSADPASTLAIGPKQDDPVQPHPGAGSSQGMLAIGPKQDDPVQPGHGRALAELDDCGMAPVPVPVPVPGQ